MTAARGIGFGALLIVAVIALWMVFGRSTAHEYTFLFQNAGQIVRGNEVRIAGRAIGKVEKIGLTEDNRAAITVTVNEPYAPLRKGTTAAIRAASLAGQANRYITLSLGPDNAPEIEDGTTLGTEKTTTLVDLDTLFATLDPKTRKGLQNVIVGSSQQYGNDGLKANESLKYFNPLVESITDLSAEINRDQQAFADAIVNTAKVTTALAERRDDLSGLVDNSAAAMGAIADESESLDRALRELPAALRGGNTTLVSLRAALDDFDQLTEATEPVAPKLEPLFKELRPLAERAEPTVRDLRLIVSRPGPANDMTDLLRAQPQLTKVSGPALSNTIESLRKSTPILKFIRPYAPDIVGWFGGTAAMTANYDASGKYARVSPVVDAFSFTRTGDGTATVKYRDPKDRQSALEFARARRCPGSVAARPADGSAPFVPDGLDCDQSAVVPGP